MTKKENSAKRKQEAQKWIDLMLKEKCHQSSTACSLPSLAILTYLTTPTLGYGRLSASEMIHVEKY